MYVYLAGPMQISNRIHNLRSALDAAQRMEDRGHTVFVPHLNELWDLVHPNTQKFWMERDFKWIRKCDILVRLPGKSEGSDAEVKLATALGMKVFGTEFDCGLQQFMRSELWTKI